MSYMTDNNEVMDATTEAIFDALVALCATQELGELEGFSLADRGRFDWGVTFVADGCGWKAAGQLTVQVDHNPQSVKLTALIEWWK